MDEKYINIAIAIRRIKTIHFNVNEILFRNDNAKTAIDLGVRNEFVPELNILSIIMRAIFRYTDSPQNEALATIEVNTTFEVENLASYIDSEERILLPENVWLSLSSMLIGHTRALFADRLAGTPYQSFVIPIMDAQTLVDRFFPKVPMEQLEDTVKEKAST